MTTTLQAHGGGAQPASIDTSGKVAGGAAQRVYGFDSAEAAQAAGYVCEGGPAMSVALITDAQIASGAWKAEGDPAALVVYTAPANMPIEGGYAVPVYPVNGWGNSTPAPVAPLFDSAEIGTVNASTVAVTFDQDVSAAGNDYSSGVTIKVNGSTRPFESGIRQSNHAIVYYALSLAVVYGDVVTWEYVEASGSIVAEDDSTPLNNVSAQSVTNNVVDTIGNALRADVVAYWTMNESSGTRADSKDSHDAVPSAALASAAGKVGNAIRFDKTQGRYLEVADHADLRNTGNLYIFGWVKVLSAAVPPVQYGYTFVIKSAYDPTTIYEYEVYYYVAGDPLANIFSFYIQGASNGANVDISPITIGDWYFIEAYYRPADGTLGIAVNGGDFQTTVFADPVNTTTSPVTIGRDPGPSPTLFDADALLDEWAILKPAVVPLSAEKRAYLYGPDGAGRTLYP